MGEDFKNVSGNEKAGKLQRRNIGCVQALHSNDDAVYREAGTGYHSKRSAVLSGQISAGQKHKPVISGDAGALYQ